ncbi:hypothetical protein EPAKOI_005086 (plasmid) [Cupriavidus sp. H18C2]
MTLRRLQSKPESDLTSGRQAIDVTGRVYRFNRKSREQVVIAAVTEAF